MDNSISIVHQTEVLGKSFQIYGTKDAPLFLAKDVADWIEHSDTSKMLRNVDDDEKVLMTHPNNVRIPQRKLLRTNEKVGYDGTQAWYLTEHGLYEVLMQSRKPIAKEFKRQVKRILTEIRQTGKYGADNLNHTLAMFASTITAMQQSMLAMQQSINNLQSRSIPLSLPGDNLPEDILRCLRTLGGVATKEQIADEVGCDEDELLLALKDLLVSNRICETRHWSLAKGTQGICYCLPSYGDTGKLAAYANYPNRRPQIQTSTAPSEPRKFANSRIPCALRHDVSGEVRHFPSMREALRFLDIPTYGVSYELARTIKKNHWEFIEINR